jgi:anti-sigma regulatory factor (Ser/Thr protein kinase)
VIVVGRSFPAHRAVLKEIRAFIRAQADEHSFDDDAETLALAVTEACANVTLVKFRESDRGVPQKI